jgi:hypothetical protein
LTANAEHRAIWAALIDTHDKAHPRLTGATADDDTMDKVRIATLDNNTARSSSASR